MEEIFFGYIEDEIFGKLAGYISSNGKIILYRVIESNGYNINEEISEEEYKDFYSRHKDEDFS